MMKALPVIVCLLISGTALAGEAPPPSFTKKPSAKKTDDGVRIEFALDRPADVAVFIEDSKGRIVRHLAAGVLGKNAPAPLNAGTLKQSILWDGTDDDGKKVPASQHRVRVGAGLRPTYAGTAFSDRQGPNDINSVIGLAVAPDGRLYVLDSRWGDRGGGYVTAMHVIRRDGLYEKTIKPFPSNLPLERVKAFGAFKTSDGRVLPLFYRIFGVVLYPYEDVMHQMTVTPKGKIILAVVPADAEKYRYYSGKTAHLAALDPDGGAAFSTYAGPALMKGLAYTPHAALACGSDGQRVYISGTGARNIYGFPKKVHHAIYHAKLPSRGPAEVFFGDPETAGGGESHLANPRGIATDGKGHLFIADFGNNRVVVLDEKGGRFLGAFAVPGPSWVGVHPKTGALYVHTQDDVVKFSGWKSPKEVARLQLPPLSESDRRSKRFKWSFALDATAEPPVLWIGRNRGGADALLRAEDRGRSFSELTGTDAYRSLARKNLSADPYYREVSASSGSYRPIYILDEESGKVVASSKEVSGEGTTHRLGPDGLIYVMYHNKGIRRFDRSGKAIPFSSQKDGALPTKGTGLSGWEKGFAIDRQGNVYVKIRHHTAGYHGLQRVDVYDRDGKFKRTAMWSVTDGALGPRIDPRGNIYFAESIKPKGVLWPAEFKNRFDKYGRIDSKYSYQKFWYNWMYGSVVKFPPEGGAVWVPPTGFGNGYYGKWNERKPRTYPFDGKSKVPASLKKVAVDSVLRGKDPAYLQGASWVRFGVSPLMDKGVLTGTRGCRCAITAEFDVDGFGRSFYPDIGRFRIGVLDTNGNEIIRFGSYGNQNAWGPDSYVLDPKSGFFRGRRKGDPADLVSPFAQPDIGFVMVVGLAVTDRYLYLADAVNRRVLRVKLDYAAEARCAVK